VGPDIRIVDDDIKPVANGVRTIHSFIYIRIYIWIVYCLYGHIDISISTINIDMHTYIKPPLMNTNTYILKVKGNILVRGPPCFGGYENNGSANEESFFTIDGEEG
jgi:long-subunit acyl-CoA synthetase (AMP-forming)